MNILDHRILIPRPKSPETVWAVIGDLSKNPTWQVDCRSVSFISTMHTGVGVRWRYTTTGGRDYVAQTTAWYDGLGYEYKIVDGLALRENLGRIRLQEIPDGTVVQWTFSYEVGGVLGGMRNALSLRRQLESAMVDSLKTLWRVVNKINEVDKAHEARSLLRDAPDYEGRLQYKPRHPSAKPVEENSSPSHSPIVEPAFSDDDTRPRQPVVPPESSPEPEFLSEIPSTPSITIIEAEQQPDTLIVLDDAQETSDEGSNQAVLLSEDDHIAKPIPSLLDQPAIVEIAALAETPSPMTADIVPDVPLVEPLQETETLASEEAPTVIAPRHGKLDTAEVSVFDLFGLPKPSETQEIARVVQSDMPTVPLNRVVEIKVEPERRVGYRVILRRKSVKLRRPVS